ncbi:Smr/MutS family protein [Hyphomicrobium sp.]|uniref:Smr/MutS family protein n=1 Tax=Hyphomicrobium sp. TaxID=82 RepID=UPI002FDFAD16
MSKPPHPPRRRHLSKEDEALWEHTAASLKPLRQRKGRHHPGVTEADETPPFAPKSKKTNMAAPHGAAKRDAKTPPAAAKPSGKATPGLASFDRKAARRLRQGQFEIDARIDLHGMRQHEAHAALRRFLISCFGRGLKWVLVITGKGGPQKPRDDDYGWSAPERGVLRKNVPMWLAEPELRAIVVSFTTAAVPHGGEGALYIQLRNPGRARP